MKCADLHLHSYFSDGTFSPEQIVEESLKAGLSCISITDHDNVDGVDIASRAAQGRLEVLPGIEMTAEVNGNEIHILGYLINHKDPSFLKMLEDMRAVRVKRIHGICDKLKKLGVGIDPEEVLCLSTQGSVGRLHVARALCQKGHVFSVAEAFQRFIGDKGPAYVSKFKMTPKEAIRWIRKVGGVPVLAHPYTLSDKALISDFVEAGIMGLEVFYTEHSDYQQNEYVKIAQKHNLLITGGSDCHGTAKENIRIGVVRLPYEHVQKLKDLQCQLR